MQIGPDRRRFLAGLSAVAVASALGGRQGLAHEGPPETTTIRIPVEDAPPYVIDGVAENALCLAPTYITADLLRAEGFTDVHYVPVVGGLPTTEAFAAGKLDIGTSFVPGAVRRLDAGVPITVLAGLHPGCFQLFAHESIRTFTDLKGKKIGINNAKVPGSPDYLFVSIMAAHVGLDPETDIRWITTDEVAQPIELFFEGRIDAYLAFVTEFPALRARQAGRVILDMALDQPWSQYFCCCLVGHADFVRQYPVATKRALRAMLKATDLCATDPARAAGLLVAGGFALHFETALQTLTDLPYNLWRELDPEDSLRFYALWLHEFGQLNSTPNQIIAAGTDWRFVSEVRRELKA